MKKYCLESQLRHEKHIFVAYFLANWLKSYDREKSSQNISGKSDVKNEKENEKECLISIYLFNQKNT